jgi:hypothetical protein
MATNFLLVKARTEQKQLAGAIAARMRQESHTVLECYGAAAVTNAIYVGSLASAGARTRMGRVCNAQAPHWSTGAGQVQECWGHTHIMCCHRHTRASQGGDSSAVLPENAVGCSALVSSFLLCLPELCVGVLGM